MKTSTKIICILALCVYFLLERNVNAQVIDTFKYTGAITTWTVPTCVTQVTITAIGATGGRVTTYTPKGGKGAKMTGTFTLAVGEVIKILVGQGGGSAAGCCSSGGGGGGGSFVTDNLNNPLIIAGGGGGVDAFSNTYVSVGINAVTTNTGQNGYSTLGGSPNNYGVGGVTGHGATNNGGSSPCAGNGGGLLTAGQNPTCCAGTSGSAFISGGAGGPSCVGGGGAGGFGGGGGSGNTGGGGGGGYGGGGGSYNNPVNGGGGGSYNGGSNQVNTAGYDSTGNGFVVLSYYVDSVVTLVGNVISNITCNAANNGIACAVTTGVPHSLSTYSWVPGGQTTDTVGGLSIGTYTVTVSAPCGLSKTASVTITQPTALTVAGNVIRNVSCYESNNGAALATPGGGTAPYTYLWTNGGGTKDTASGLSAGMYRVKVTDNNGCVAFASVSITQPNVLTAGTNVTSNARCGISNGSATSTVGGGTAPYTYAWTGGETTASVSGLSGGTYTLDVTDNNGCRASSSITISSTPAVFASATTNANILCYGDNVGLVSSRVNGGTLPYTYLWSPGGNTDYSVANLNGGTYTLTVTDANGCISSASTTVTQPAPITIVKDSTADLKACTGSAWVVVNGGISPYTYLWSNGNTTYYLYDQCSGTYCCTVTDANGCTKNTCIRVTSPTGIDNVTDNSGQIVLYPNPNNGQFTISAPGIDNESFIVIYNVLGEKVYSQQSTLSSNPTINLSNQSNGIYLYRVMTESGNLLGEGKIIIQK